MIVSFDEGKLTLIDDSGYENIEFDDIDRNELFISSLNDFISSLNSSHESENSFSNVYKGHLLALKIKDSLIKGSPVLL